jgi:tetratricopeptide (TPR) repeat protein
MRRWKLRWRWLRKNWAESGLGRGVKVFLALAVGLTLLIWGGFRFGSGVEDPRWDAEKGSGGDTETRSGGDIQTPRYSGRDEALERLQAQVRKKPGSPEAHVRLAYACLQRDRLRDAAEEFREVLQGAPRHAEAWVGLSILAARMGKPEEALALAQRGAELNPQDPKVLNHLAVLLTQADRMEEAGKVFERVVKLVPDQPEVLQNVARYWEAMEDWKQAETTYRRMVQAAPEQLGPRLLLGDWYLRRKQADRAVQELSGLARHFPHNAVAQEALGRALRAQGRLKEARAAFLKAQRLQPRWLPPYLEAGEVCRALQDEAGARKHFEQALRVAPNTLQAQLPLAEILLLQGQTDRAIEVYEQLLAAHPGELLARNNLAYLYAEKGEHLDRAYEWATELVKAFPEEGNWRDTLGWVLYRQGRYAAALPHLEKAVQQAPQKGIFHYHRGQTLRALHRGPEAAEALQKALALGLPPREKKAAEAALKEGED